MTALIENDANVNAYLVSSERLYSTMTMLDIAVMRKNTAAASLLRYYGAKTYLELSSGM